MADQNQLAFVYDAPQEVIEPASVQRSVVPVGHSRPAPSPLVLKLIREGLLDFLDIKRLPPGVKERKVQKKGFTGKQKFWRKPVEK
jgi:hypothetical protein